METTESSENPLVILNPAANRGKIHRYRSLLRPYIERTRAEYVETGRPGEARERAQQAAQQGRPVIIVGGDGSVHEVVNGLLSADRRVPLGIIAAGSGNDYAWRALQLPRDPVVAMERAFYGQAIAVDAGRVNDCYFVNSFGVGLDANIAQATGWLKKLPFMSGARLYYTAAVQQLLFGYSKCPWLTCHLDGEQQAVEKRYVLFAVTNGPTYGAGFRINPRADYLDGLFDVCAIAYAPLLRALTLLPVVKKGEHERLAEVTFYRAKTLQIESKKMVTMLLDGETKQATSFDVQILPGALLVRM